jgi:hypothetical protein
MSNPRNISPGSGNGKVLFVKAVQEFDPELDSG